MNAIYNQFVASKAKTGTAILQDLMTLNHDTLERVMSRMHAAVGMVTELNELSRPTGQENKLEELGDYLFYLTLLRMHAGESERPLAVPEIAIELQEAQYAAGEILDLCAKREVIYCRELNSEQVVNFVAYLWVLEGFYSYQLQVLGVTAVEVQEYNMAKLDKRYAQGYSNEAAAARADKKEGE